MIDVLLFQRQNQYQMSDINSTLIGFLKKKSLFSNSPHKNLMRSASRDSKDKNQPLLKKPVSYNPEFKSTKSLSNKMEPQPYVSMDFDSASQSSDPALYDQTSAFQKLRSQHTEPTRQRPENGYDRGEKDERTGDQERKTVGRGETQKSKDIRTGVKTTTFESARLESAQCLDNMLIKMKAEMNVINYKLSTFRSEMSSQLDKQLANLHKRILQMVDQVIQENLNNIKSYIQQQERVLAADLINMQNTLAQQYKKVEIMKEEINKPNWRKVAGELLASQLEDKIDDLVATTKSMQVRHWDLKDFGTSKWPAFQRELRKLVKIGTP